MFAVSRLFESARFLKPSMISNWLKPHTTQQYCTILRDLVQTPLFSEQGSCNSGYIAHLPGPKPGHLSARATSLPYRRPMSFSFMRTMPNTHPRHLCTVLSARPSVPRAPRRPRGAGFYSSNPLSLKEMSGNYSSS